jgi:tetratricopeptide (TPR) repeat protein
MRNKTWKIIGLFLLLSGIIACSSSKPVQKQTVQEIINQKINSAEEKKQANLDIAHEAFLRALMLEQKGEHSMALEFLAHASKADPKNRYLAFQVAMKVAETGDYKMALAIAENSLRTRNISTSFYSRSIMHW